MGAEIQPKNSSSLNVTLNFEPPQPVTDMKCRENLSNSGGGTAQDVHRSSRKVQLTFDRTQTKYNVGSSCVYSVPEINFQGKPLERESRYTW
jgi:hypothetical protein